MSMGRCDKCRRQVDTDEDCECSVEHMDEKHRIPLGYEILCQPCREGYQAP